MKQMLDIVFGVVMLSMAVMFLCAAALAVFATVQYIFYGVS